MARIIQAVYDLKDNVVAKLRTIGDAIRGHKRDSDQSTTAINANNAKQAASFARTADAVGRTAERTSGMLGRLRNVFAGIFAAVTVRGAAQAVQGIAELGDSAEKTRMQLARMFGSQAAGDKAYASLKKFADDNAQAFSTTLENAVQLKAFGLDPLAGAMRALVDENAAMGGTQERLAGTISAVGQAWTKQKLQTEEILQLIERGVPVWEILQRITGKTAAELQDLASAGKLGRTEISALIKEIGRMNFGAAAGNAGTLSGLITQLSSRVRQFFTDVSNRGPLDYFKAQLRGAIETVDGLAKSGELEAWARQVGTSIVSVSSAIVGGVRFLVDYAGALLLVAKGYAAIKIGNFLVDLAATARGAANAAVGVSSLGTALRSLPLGVKIGIALVGLDLAMKGATALGDAIGRNLPATKAWEERSRALNEETRASAERYRAATAELDRYRAVQVKSADAVGVMTTAERQRYSEGLAGLQSYINAQIVYYNTLDKIGQLNDEGRQHLADLRARLAEVKGSFETLRTTAAAAVDQFGGLSEGARLLVKQFDAVGTSAKGIGAELTKAFAQLDTDNVTKVGDIGLALVQVAKESESAASAVRGGLAMALRELSSSELLKFQSSAVAAFDAAKVSAKDTAAVLDATLLVALEKLDVAPAKFGMGMTDAGRQAVAAFATITENARATAAQIEAAFVAATRAANSREDLEALGAALKAAADQGRISFEAAERATLALKSRLRELRAEADPLGDAYARLGIQSQQALDDARDSAREAFDAIVVGARRGVAAQTDVQRAFEAYAAAARAAAADSTQAIRDQVEAQLQAQAAALGLRDALNEAGAAGANAGSTTATAADTAAAALGNLAGAADDAASGADSLSDSGDRAADTLARVAADGSDAAFAMNDVSRAFADAANSANGLDRVAFGELALQREQAEALLTTLRQQNAAYDERAARIENLRRQFTYLGDETLARLADEQRQLDENLKRREEDARRRRDEQQREGGQSSGSSSGGRVQVEFVHTVKAEGGGTLTQQAFDGLLQEAGRSGKLGRFFNDSLRRSMTNAGAGNGR